MPVLRLLPEFETALRQLPSVRAVSVVTGPDSHPTEIHVLARPGKGAKQIVRDVQSLAMAQFDLEVDHRIISIVQFDEQEAPLAVVHDISTAAVAEAEAVEVEVRPVLTALALRVSGGQAEIAVTISAAGEEFVGTANGAGGGISRSRVVAEATVAAVAELLGLPVLVDSAMVVDAGPRRVALVVLLLTIPRVGEQVVTGSALVREDEADGVARAVLGALNRRLTG